MSDRFRIGDLRLTEAGSRPGKLNRHSGGGTASFGEILDRSTLKFSHHAQQRMEQRGIALQPETLTKIVSAIDRAAGKGARDSLIVYRDIAMIVNVPSRTVVTALDGKALQDNVFTQIDSAVIVS